MNTVAVTACVGLLIMIAFIAELTSRRSVEKFETDGVTEARCVYYKEWMKLNKCSDPPGEDADDEEDGEDKEKDEEEADEDDEKDDVVKDSDNITDFTFEKMNIPDSMLISVAPIHGVYETSSGFDSDGVVEAKSAEECMTACSENEMCGGFTYYTSEQGFSDTGKKCKLMSLIPEDVRTVDSEGKRQTENYRKVFASSLVKKDPEEDVNSADEKEEVVSGNIQENERVKICDDEERVFTYEGIMTLPQTEERVYQMRSSEKSSFLYIAHDGENLSSGDEVQLSGVMQSGVWNPSDNSRKHVVVKESELCPSKVSRIPIAENRQVYRCVPNHVPQICRYIGYKPSDGNMVHVFESKLWTQLVTYYYKAEEETAYFDTAMTLLKMNVDGSGYLPESTQVFSNKQMHIFRSIANCGDIGGNLPPENIEDSRQQFTERYLSQIKIVLADEVLEYSINLTTDVMPMLPTDDMNQGANMLVRGITITDEPIYKSSEIRKIKISFTGEPFDTTLKIDGKDSFYYVLVNGKYRFFYLNGEIPKVLHKNSQTKSLYWKEVPDIVCTSSILDDCAEEIKGLPRDEYPVAMIFETES
ncbi:PAN domain-containing protein [Tetraselmis virus 1]|uniref:PAN domain-containing protein n=1 Tax=Tetraselmis virus 1 TaxID=2060617 RepID=A0A2P0VNG3_9VIRU|nr:PAN domain-containing protein [Tetraselmis virus 1]AUF82442.1 PAN domain-containing protein [Tetraselmis virus 1]